MKKLFYLFLSIATLADAANELSTQDSTTFQKNNATYQISLSEQTTITGNFAYDAVLAVPTNGVAVSFGAALPVGTVTLFNITTNAGASIKYGQNITSNNFGVLPPGSHAKFRPFDGGTNLWLQGTTNVIFTNNVRVFGVSQ